MLTRLRVENYKSLVDFEFAPPKLAVLIGPNGAGKTSIGAALYGLGRLLAEGVSVGECFPAKTLCQWSKSALQAFDLEYDVKDGHFTYRLDLIHAPTTRTVRIAVESLSLDGKLLYECRDGEVRLFGDNPGPSPRTTFPFDRTRSFLPLLEERPDNRRIRAFRSLVQAIIVLHPNPFAMTGRSEREESRLAPDGSNFAAFYRWFQQARPERLQPYFDSLRAVFPTFKTLRSVDSGSGVKELRALFAAPEGGEINLTVDDLSEGQRQLMFLYLLLQDLGRPSVLFLDEPDNFVSVREVQPFLIQLEDALSEAGSQALVISHGTDVMDFLDSRQAFAVTRPDGGPSAIEKLDGSSGSKASSWMRFADQETSGAAK
ncbi:MAG: AAA family ATPase [Archangium sp.]|nr:AAA family ATPase [Archangium sp.]